MVFSSSAWPTGLPDNGDLKTAKALDFPLGQLAPNDNLIIWDRDSNNAAIRVVKNIKESWSVHPSDYDFVGLIKVRVEHEGQAVAAAQVTVTDKTGRHEDQIVDPSSKGEVSFFGFSQGELKVAVSYRSNGKAAGPWKQGFEINLKRDRAEPLLVVSIPDSVETVAAGSSASGKANASDVAKGKTDVKAPVAAKTSPLGSFFAFLIALAIAAGVIYGLMIYIKNNQKAVGDRLKSLGVEMPDPSPQPGDVPPPTAVPAAPEPLQKIILGDAAPEPIGIPMAVPISMPSAPTGVPRLVRDTGEVLNLADGENLVGRDVGLAVSLAAESTVSRRHASITQAGSSIVLKDLGSTNGTYVNGNKVDTERTLSAGDAVQFGQVHFRFEM